MWKQQRLREDALTVTFCRQAAVCLFGWFVYQVPEKEGASDVRNREAQN